MALAVTTKMKAIIRQRDTGIVSANETIQHLLVEVRRQIVAELASAPADSFSSFQLQRSLSVIDDHIRNFDSAVKSELKSRLSDSWELGQTLLPEAAMAAGMQLNSYWLSGNILTALESYAFTRINGLTSEMMTRIRGELTLGMLGQKTPQDIAGEIAAQIKGLPLPKGRFGHPIFKSVAERAEVITGLEMGRAFSMATELSISAAQETVPKLQRMWIHAGHPSTPRQVHLLMHGQVRKVGKPFFTSAAGGAVMYPRAPDAPISEVIRCGCTHVPYHPGWGNKKEFIADWDIKQEKANQPKGA